MKKYILKILLISIMLGLAGCGKDVKEETGQEVVNQDSIVVTENEHRDTNDQLFVIAENKGRGDYGEKDSKRHRKSLLQNLILIFINSECHLMTKTKISISL